MKSHALRVSELLRRKSILGVLGGAVLAGCLPCAAVDASYGYDASANPVARSTLVPGLPQIVGQPVDQIVSAGEVATFTVVLANSSGATFQWKFNNGAIGGATSDSLVIPSVAPGNAGLYSVTVTNGSGNVTSSQAELFLDSDGDGLPDSWELANFGNLAQSATGDFDSDGSSNIDEYRDDTDPSSNVSRLVHLSVSSPGGEVTLFPPKAGYAIGESVTLTAVATPPNGFLQWEGAIGGSENPRTLVMTENLSLTARFIHLPLPSAAVAWWRGEGNANDFAGNHHGTYYSGATPIATATTPSGEVGAALDFNGVRHMRVTDTTDLRPDRFAIEAWVFPTLQLAGSQTIVARGSSVNHKDAWLLALVNGKPRFVSEHLVSGPHTLDASNNVPLNQWTHLAVTFDGYTKVLYVNGAVATSAAGLGPLVYDPAAVPVTVGCDWASNAPTEHFNGRIDELTLYGLHLTAAEVAAIYNGSHAGKSTSEPAISSPETLPDAVVGQSYAVALSAASGPGPMAFTRVAGSLPAGLALGENGTFSGTPTATGESFFSIVVRNASGHLNRRDFSLRVTQPLPPPLGITAWWRGEPHASGLAKDAFGGNDGSFFDGTTPVSASHTAAGKVGAALSFPSSSLHVRVPDAAALKPPQITVEAWVYPTWLNFNQQAIAARGSTSSFNDPWYFGLRNGFVEFATFHPSVGQDLLQSSIQVPIYEWTHIAITFDGSRKVIYVNGVAVAAKTGMPPLSYDAGAPPITLAADWDFNQPVICFTGRIDEVTLYQRALSDWEVMAIYDAGGAGKSQTGPFSIDLGRVAVNRPIASGFNFTAGVPPVTWTLINGTPPGGVALQSNGSLAGTTPTPGLYGFTVRGTDFNGAIQDQTGWLQVFLPAERPPDLVSWYRAENNADDFIGSNEGTATGGVTYQPGKVGTAFLLDGSNGTVSIPDAPSLRTASMTFEGWVMPSSVVGATRVIAGKAFGTAFANSWGIFVQGSLLGAGFSSNTSNFFQISTQWNPQPGRWYHLAYSFNDATHEQRLYVDGIRVANSIINASIGYDSHPVRLGSDTNNEVAGEFFHGEMDEASIYSRALSDAEILEIYLSDVAGKVLPGFGDFDDLDGDGLINLVEYGINTPLSSSNGGLQGGVFIGPFGPQAVIQVLRDPRRTDVVLEVESSGDLIDWVPVATSWYGDPFDGIAGVSGEVAGIAPRIVTITDPYTGSRGFLRVRVSR